MKRSIKLGLISELVLSLCSVACFVIAIVYGAGWLVAASVVVTLLLLLFAGRFLAEHLEPGCKYHKWLWNVFCKQWIGRILFIDKFKNFKDFLK